MGSYCSVHNDTDVDMWIKYGPNMAALGIASSLAIMLPGKYQLQTLTTAGLAVATHVFDNELRGQGYSRVGPGGTYRSEKLTLSLFLQANIVQVGADGMGRRGVVDCWTGATDGACVEYRASQARFSRI